MFKNGRPLLSVSFVWITAVITLAGCAPRAWGQAAALQLKTVTGANTPPLRKNQPGWWPAKGIFVVGSDTGNIEVGPQFRTYDGAPPASMGNVSDWCVDITSGNMYQKTGAGWAFQMNLTGPRGLQGIQGQPGASTVGPAGSDGKDGNSATLAMGTIIPLFTSATPTASMGGTVTARTLNLGLPAAPFVFMVSVPPIAVAEIGTSKSVSFTFPVTFPDTDYAYFVQIMGGTGIVTSITWTESSKTTSALTLNVKSSIAVLAGTTRVWVMVAHKNAP